MRVTLIPAWLFALGAACTLATATAVATAFAILGRRLRYGGVPRPAEWLALLALVFTATEAMPDIDAMVDRTAIALGTKNSTFDVFFHYRWRWAGGATIVALILSLIANRFASGPREGIRTPLLTLVLLAMVWGPLRAFPRYLHDWLLFERFSSAVPAWINGMAIADVVGSLPLGILLAVPMISAFKSLFRGRGKECRWTGAVGGSFSALACAALLSILIFGGTEFEIGVELTLVVVSCFLSIPLIRPFERAAWLVEAYPACTTPEGS